ncbi:unnamed protein product [Lymnaea stagnalis]|uniref:CUB domain-containing protein n=1 Tax=Lymnaea stagnalis TaxID=6523 RepID=A0AAV2H1P2_LYMST
MTYNMSCNTYHVFHCTAEQENHWSGKTISIYKHCPTQLKEKTKHSTFQLDSMINKTLLIKLHVYGYPKPTRYSLIKNGNLLIKFDNVTAGNALDSIYMIAYQDEGSPYGRVNLRFNFLDEKTSGYYVFSVDNGIVPQLNYSFSVHTGILTSTLQPNVVALVVGIGAAAAFLLFIFVICYFRKKVSCYQTNLQSKSSSDSYEGIVYEEIDLNYESHGNLQAGNDNQITIDSQKMQVEVIIL